MKIGIITIIDFTNYGNRLQNYAVQELLLSLGHEVETIKNDPSDYIADYEKAEYKEKIIFGRIRYKLIERVRKVKHFFLNYNNKLKYGDYRKLENDKIDNLIKYSKKNIEFSKFEIQGTNIPNGLDSSYNYFLVGSDQVWNPNHRKGYPVDFLVFTEKSKRISYAPSIGVSSLPNEFTEKYTQYLSGFNTLSVREEAGKNLIYELTGKPAKVLVDPTLMLTKEKWLETARAPKHKPKGKYILTYFLGKVDKDYLNIINEISSNYNLEIINLANFEDQDFYSIDPSEFVDLFSTAKLIFTNSFHGVVFSILFERNFVVFKRGNMNSRIDTILSLFGLESRKFENINMDHVFQTDFTDVSEILKKERTKSLEYLKKVIQ